MGELTLETGLLMGEDMVERTEEMAEESSSKVKFRGEAGRTMVAGCCWVLDQVATVAK